MTTDSLVIALIHATPAAIVPAVAGLRSEFPEAVPWNLLDDRLLVDAAQTGGLTADLRSRMLNLIRHAADNGADGVLLTCSMYGPTVHETPMDIPVLAPDEAAFEATTDGAPRGVVVVASIASSLEDSLARYRQFLADTGRDTRAIGVCVPAAFDHANAGDHARVAEVIANEVRAQADRYDAVFLAQYSLAPAAAILEQELGTRVITGPASAAQRLRRLLTTPQTSHADV